MLEVLRPELRELIDFRIRPHVVRRITGSRYALVVVLLNAAPAAQTLVVPELAGRHLRLHPVQRDSADPVVRTASFVRSSGTFTVPGRTAAVFVAGDDH